MMFRRLLGLLPLVLFLTLLPSATSFPLAAETDLAGTEANVLAQAGDLAPPLNAQPGDEVTIRAEVDGQSKTQTFIAQPGGQQIDVVLAQNRVQAAWQRADLPGRDFHAIAYDAARERVVLFGGYDGNNDLGDTWEWDGNSWIQRLPLASPSARRDHAMAYDAARERVVLFGGESSQSHDGPLDDTWEWNGETWIERPPSRSPLGRYGHAMAYDAARERVVLFGGHSSGPSSYGDTWEWDGMTWEQQQPLLSPPERSFHTMGYDGRRGKVVLFGGAWESDALYHSFADTWEWDGSTWTQFLPLISPPARYSHAMAYDAARERVLLFGGASESVYGDTWEWDGSAWVEQNPPLSPPAGFHAMGYDAGRERIVLVGGYSDGRFLSDTWEWDGNEWTLPAEALFLPLVVR